LRKQTFIQGAFILMAAGIFNRILGFVPRMVLPRIIGAEGVGLYQMGYPLLIVILTFITGGIPLAVSKLVAEAESEGDERKVRTILRLSMAFSVMLGALFTGLSLALSSWITRLVFTDPRVHTIFIVMSPIIFLVSISSVLRGYFQGRSNMIPPAASTVAETVIRAIAVLVFAWMLLPRGLEYAAAGAMGGVLLGEFGALLVLVFTFRRNRTPAAIANMPPSHAGKSAPLRRRRLFRRFLHITVPVTAGKLVGSASYFLESIMIIQSLAVIGVAASAATAQYGALQGMVMPILLIPTALTYSLSVSLVPALSEAAARSDLRTIHKRLHQSLRLALVAGAPFAAVFCVSAVPLCAYLYKDASVAPMLQLFAPAAIFVYLQAPFQAALQSLDRPGTALLNTFIGAAVKLILIYVLGAKLSMGIYGAVLAICVNIVLVTVLHWRSADKLLGFRMRADDFLKVGFGAGIMTLTILALNRYAALPGFGGFVLTMLCAAVVYLFCMIKMKLIDADDLRRIPWIGRRIAPKR
jgi:stage V sporulation protein B